MITDIETLIETLGGPTKAAEALGATNAQQVWMWKARGKIGTRLFLRHQEALKRHGIVASPDLWFKTPAQRGAA